MVIRHHNMPNAKFLGPHESNLTVDESIVDSDLGNQSITPF